MFGEDVWDLNPIRLKAARISAFRFDQFFDRVEDKVRALIDESKYLMFCLMFYSSTGKSGRLTPGVLQGYMLVLRSLARFCHAQGGNSLVGEMSIGKLVSSPAYFASYLRYIKSSEVGQTHRSILRALLKHMVLFGEERLGYRLQGVFDLDFGIDGERAQQHPVIPTRIYLGLINQLGDNLDYIYPYADGLESLISSFADRKYGYTKTHQRKKLRLKVGELRSDFEEARKIHGVDALFNGDYACSDRGVLSSVILKIQFVIKNILHLYTGMRDQEVLRLPYDCMRDEEYISNTSDDQGEIRDRPKFVKVLSTSTKFTGVHASESWLAPDDVVRAVLLAQAICRGLAMILGVPVRDLPLFMNPAVINRENVKVGVPYWNPVSKPGFLKSFTIEEKDIQELVHTDPNRDYSQEKEFFVGEPWPLTSHQYRRSLAFYASSSGFVSLPTLRKQFKHLSVQMTRYYSNNFEKIKTVFGFYDPETDEFVLPKGHFIFEYQTGVPISIAYDLIVNVLGSDSPLFGGVGKYVTKQREISFDSNVSVFESRAEVQKDVLDGKISYSDTLLGGCTKPGRCDSYMLGDVTSCLSCDGAAINPDKVDAFIAQSYRELDRYEKRSAEYQITKSELDDLLIYREKMIKDKELP